MRTILLCGAFFLYMVTVAMHDFAIPPFIFYVWHPWLAATYLALAIGGYKAICMLSEKAVAERLKAHGLSEGEMEIIRELRKVRR